MANLIKLSNDLEYVPKEQLIQMSQNPDSTYPSYLVLAEIQRRTQNEKAYAAQQPQPETTVAEEVVQEYASSPQGLGAMTQPSGGNLSTPGAESNMAPPSPMQMMASGGLTGYDEGGKTKFPLLEAKSKVTKEQNKQILNKIADARLEKFGVAGKMSNLGDRAFSIMGGSGNNIRLNPTEEKLYIQLANEMIEKKASGGRTGYQVGGSLGIGGDSLSNTFINPMENEELPEQIDPNILDNIKQRYTDPDGTFAYQRALKDGFNAATLAMIVAPEPTSSFVGTGLRGVAGAGKGLFNFIKSPKQTIDKGLSAIGRMKSRMTEGKRFNNPISNPQSTSNLPVVANKFKDMGADVVKKATPRVIGSAIIGAQLLPNNIEEEINNEDITKTAEQLEIDRLNALLAETRNKDVETVDTSSDRRNADMLVGLGGAIMKSNTIGELGSNISDSYTNVRNKQDANKLAGLQGRMAELQIEKAETELANMPEQRLIQQYGFIQDAIDAHKDGTSILDEATLAKYIKQKSLLLEQIMAYGNVNLSGSQTSAMAEAKIT